MSSVTAASVFAGLLMTSLVNCLHRSNIQVNVSIMSPDETECNNVGLESYSASYTSVEAYLSLKVKGQAGDSVCVDVLQNGHCLRGVGVPHTDVRLLPHLSGGHQHTLRMQR